MVLSPEKIEQIKQEVTSVPPEEREAKIQEVLATLDPEEIKQLQEGGGSGSQCPFCLMAEGKIEVRKVFENEKALAILDINPASKGHTLVFLKQHNSSLTDANEKDSAYLMKVALAVAKALVPALEAQGVNIFVASGAVAGQTAPHLLVNVIPRFNDDGVKFGWAPKKISEDEMEQIKKKAAEKAKSIKVTAEQEVIKKELPPEEKAEKGHFLRIA